MAFERPKVGPLSDKYSTTIRKENGYRADSFTYYPVVIIGAGFSGIAMACRLKEALGFDQFRIFDRQSGIGGTWWINRYPGVACDVPAIFYSFSFCPNPKWTAFHPEGPEIVEYLQGVCDRYQIVDKIQVNTDVRACTWLESEQVWELKLQHMVSGAGDLSEYDRVQKAKTSGPSSIYGYEETIRAKIVVSGVGGLVEPNQWPKETPGRDLFQGEIFHSARWNYDVDLKHRNVIVVGTGCSSAQLVPKLTAQYGALSVTQIMRSPPWVVPRALPPGGEEGWKTWAPFLSKYIPGFQLGFRQLIFWGAEGDFWNLFGSESKHEKNRNKAEVELLKHMRSTVPKKYHEMLTPNYSFGCKRKLFDATWFKGLNDDKIELTTLPLTSVGERTVTLGPGRTYPPPETSSLVPSNEVTIPADVIILANGFNTTEWLHPLDITGREGKKLHEVFAERGGAQMYMGAALDGFPNFFTIFGPNTATGHSSVILASENMVELSLKFIGPILKGDVSTVEVKKEAELAWAKDIQSSLKKTVWHTGGCRSWYMTEEGWNSTVYPYSQVWFSLRCMFPTWKDWDIRYTSKGIFKRRAGRLIRVLSLVGIITAIVRLRKNPQNFRAILRRYAVSILTSSAKVLQGTAQNLRV